MRILSHYYKCSSEYLSSISPDIEKEINQVLNKLTGEKDTKIPLDDLAWILASNGWAFSQPLPDGPKQSPTMNSVIESNDPELCKTSSNLEIETESDFAKKFDTQMVQLEIQADDLEEIASDLIKFRIAFAEKRIQVGIEIIIQNGNGLSEFENVKDMLVKLDVDCPVWLISIG